MNPELTKPKNNLPSIAELYANDSLEPLARLGAFQVLVNQNPKKEWIKQHPTIGRKVRDADGQEQWVPIEYLPIERVEWLLTNIFLRTRVKIKKVQLIGNSVVVTVRLFFYNHIDQEWDWQDGVGAQPLQTDTGHGAIDFNALKSAAVQMAAPAAESYAVKDAAEKIGKLFGKDLNRKDIISYDSLGEKYIKPVPKTAKEKEAARITEWIEKAQTVEELEKLRDHCKDDQTQKLFNDKETQLKTQSNGNQ